MFDFEVSDPLPRSQTGAAATSRTIAGELETYARLRLQEGKTVFNFWRTNSKQFPKLSKLAKTLFHYQAISVASEQLFSASGYTQWDRRCRLFPYRLGRLIFIQQYQQHHHRE